MSEPAAVIFDLDGTLIDTESLTMQAQIGVFRDFGLDPDPAFFHRLIGVDDTTAAQLVRDHFDFHDIATLDRAIMDRCIELYALGISLKPGVDDLLDHLDQTGLPRAIATSSRMDQARRKLVASGLGARFDTLISVDCVTAAKPAPDPYLLAASRLGVAPSSCVAFEDSETGAQSAKSAGMMVVQVPDILPTDGVHAHHVCDTLLDGAQVAGIYLG